MTRRELCFVPTNAEIDGFKRDQKSVSPRLSPLVLAALALLNIVNLSIVALRRHPQYAFAFALFFGLSVALLLTLIIRQFVSRNNAFRVGATVRLTIDDEAIGIDGEQTKPPVLYWEDVCKAYEFPTSFAIAFTRGYILSFPKRAFEDGGAAFWGELRTHLTSTRYLIHALPPVGRSITNTRLRRHRFRLI